MVNGKALTESQAITRYVAKQAGLVPQDDLQAAYADALFDSFEGFMPELYRKIVVLKAEPAEKQRILKEDMIPNKINPMLTRLNERLATREWYISDKVTWSDLGISMAFSKVAEYYPDLLKDFPNVQKLVEKVQALPAIKKWISTRPVAN